MQRFAECQVPPKKPFWKRCLDGLKAPLGCVPVVKKRASSTKGRKLERVDSFEKFRGEVAVEIAKQQMSKRINISGDANPVAPAAPYIPIPAYTR